MAQATDVHGKVLNYSYDAAGNRAELKIGGTNHSTYAYDVVNRLTQLTDEASQNFTFGYDIANRLISKTLPNGITTSYNYDGMNRLTELKDQTTSNVLFDRQYAYNTASQINQISEPSLTRNFAYDLVDRLTQVTNPTNTSESYAYDDVGNRTSSHLSASYTHQATNRLTADANKTYVYDANGSMTSKTDGTNSWSYNWDFENRLASVSNGTSSVSYEYDALGRRVKRVEGTNVTKYTFDGMDVVLDDDTTAGITKYQNGLGIDSKLELSNGSTSKYFLQDHLGSTNALTDSSGNIVSSASYDSFGNSTNTLGTRYQFTGREKDDFSGLTYYRARWYDSNLGRFISEDPIGLGGGINQFGYVGNNPLSGTDSLGLDAAYDQQVWQAQQDLLEALAPAIQFGIGFGDNVLFGLSKYARPSVGVDECSAAYQAGEWTSIAIQAAEGGVGIYRAGGWLAGRFAARRAAQLVAQDSPGIAREIGIGYNSFSAFKRAYGPAGEGMAWHHIVEQTPVNIAKFGNETIHNTENLMKLEHGAGSIHAKVSGFYSSKQPFTQGQTVRQWLSPQSFQEQYEFGIKTLKQFGWKP